MRNDLEKHKLSDSVKWIFTAVLILLLILSVFAIITKGFKVLKPAEWFKSDKPNTDITTPIEPVPTETDTAPYKIVPMVLSLSGAGSTQVSMSNSSTEQNIYLDEFCKVTGGFENENIISHFPYVLLSYMGGYDVVVGSQHISNVDYSLIPTRATYNAETDSGVIFIFASLYGDVGNGSVKICDFSYTYTFNNTTKEYNESWELLNGIEGLTGLGYISTSLVMGIPTAQ